MVVASGIELTLDLDGLGTGVVYLLVFGFVFLESGILLGFFLPGDALLFGAGLLAASPYSAVALWPLAIGVTVAAVAGDGVGYVTGLRVGRPWLERRPAMARHIERAEAFYARWGSVAVVIARWFPWLRTATPVVAGVARMPYRRFAVANVIGALSWGMGLVLLGYYSYEISWLRATAIAIGLTSAALMILAATVRGVRGRLSRRALAAEDAGAPPPAH
ncbi:MAG TPA: DedA family protein [Sporichthya sp.]|nr:DedA family protein [Sporichthya sp.]